MVIAWAAWRRQRGTVALAALTFLLNTLLIGRLAWHPEVDRAKVAGNFALHVLSLNVRMSNRNTLAVLEHVMAADADVVFLIEVDQQWLKALTLLRSKYPYSVENPRSDNFGVALFSRIPWTTAEVLSLGAAQLPSIEARMVHQGHEFVLIGTHPLPPEGRRYARLRDDQLRQLAERVARLKEPALLLGDLNATPWSAGMRIVMSKGLGFRSLSPPWTPTWRAGSIFAIPIDHALGTSPLVVTGRSIGPDVGSDHRSLNYSVSWAQ